MCGQAELCQRPGWPWPLIGWLARQQAASDAQKGRSTFGSHGWGAEPPSDDRCVVGPLPWIPSQHFGPPWCDPDPITHAETVGSQRQEPGTSPVRLDE